MSRLMRTDSDHTRKAPVLLTRAIGVLDAFLCDETELTVAEIADSMGAPRSTVYRLVHDLSGLRVLSPGSWPGRYRLGLKLLEWGARGQQALDVRREALPMMEQLRDRFGETIHLAVRDGLEGIFVETVESRHGIRQHTVVGQRVPLHAGASMHVLLAYAPTKVIDECLTAERLQAFGSGAMTDETKVRRMIDRVRSKAYARSDGEVYTGSVAISVPVFGASAEVVASMTISGPGTRWTPTKARNSLRELRSASSQLTRQLGGPEPRVDAIDGSS